MAARINGVADIQSFRSVNMLDLAEARSLCWCLGCASPQGFAPTTRSRRQIVLGIRAGLGSLRVLSRPAVKWGLVALIAGETTFITTMWWLERSELKAQQYVVTYNTKSAGSYFRKTASRSLRLPPVISAADAKLDPTDEVVGVVLGGQARAYRLGVLRDRDHHVINDVVRGVPVSVTFCDLTDCVRVYTDAKNHPDTPLDVAAAGLIDGELVLKIEGVLYLQKTGKPMMPEAGPPELPYASLAPERMSWAEWSRRHPDTEVFVDPPGARRQRSRP